MALAGRNQLLRVSTASSSGYATVAFVKTVTLNHAGNPIDVSVFGDNWHEKIIGLKDFSISGDMFYSTTDTTGQAAMRSALVNDTTLFAGVLIDGSTGFKGEVKVTKFDISGAVDAAVMCAFELQGTSALANMASSF